MTPDKDHAEEREIENTLSQIAVEEGLGLPQSSVEIPAYESKNAQTLVNAGPNLTLREAIDRAQTLRKNGLLLSTTASESASEYAMAARNSEGISEELYQKLNEASDKVRGEQDIEPDGGD